MRQTTLAEEGFERFRKPTRREKFLEEMDQIVPWKRLFKAIKPCYPKGQGGRPPIGIDRMLRIYFLQHWFDLSDPGAEEALYESRSMRRFVGIDLGREPVPDETTICKFRHLLEKHGLGERLFEEIKEHLQRSGIRIGLGSIVDATIIHAPSSTKNAEKKRDPEMKSTKKGGQWYFGMKVHIGIDSETKMIHSAVATSANVHDSQMLPKLLHGQESKVWGDSAYRGQTKALHEAAPYAKDLTSERCYRNRSLSDDAKARNRKKSQIRARVEHPFLIMKRIFGFTKVCYRGLAKNENRMMVGLGLVNLYLSRRKLLQQT